MTILSPFLSLSLALSLSVGTNQNFQENHSFSFSAHYSHGITSAVYHPGHRWVCRFQQNKHYINLECV